MHSVNKLAYVAAFLTFFTCLGHTIGTTMPIPAEQTTLIQAYETMSNAQVQMPVGPRKSLLTVFQGNNICVSLFLAMLGVGIVQLTRQTPWDRNRAVLYAVSNLGIALIAAIHFFPVPAICTGLAGVLLLVAAYQSPVVAPGSST